MTRVQRKLLVQTLMLGGALTVAVTFLDHVGRLGPLERWLYDRRAAHNQRWTPPPTDKLVHVDIDDRAIEVIGRFPWKRSVLAALLDELDAAGAKAIALDLIFPDVEDAEQDSILAASIERAGNVMLPVSLTIKEKVSTQYARFVNALTGDLELTEQELTEQVAADDPSVRDMDPVHFRRQYYAVRRKAMFRRISQEMAAGRTTLGDLRTALLPRTGSLYTGSVHLRLLEAQFRHVQAMQQIGRLAVDAPADIGRIVASTDKLPPHAQFASRAAATCFVDYLPDDDGVLRTVPLWAYDDGRLYPHFGLALACRMLDVPIEAVTVEADAVTIPQAGEKAIVLPVYEKHVASLGQPVAALFDVPWRGPQTDWWLMYDPQRQRPVNHLPISQVWEVTQTSRKIESNMLTFDDALLYVTSLTTFMDEQAMAEYQAGRPALDDLPPRLAERDELMKLFPPADLEQLLNADEAELSEDERDLQRSIRDLRQIPIVVEQLSAQLARQTARLAEQVQGRAALVGWTATGVVADFVPTSLHYSCPGPVVHGAVFNAIMTRDFWRRAPRWVTPVLTLLIGLAVTAMVARMPPLWSTIASLAVGFGYFLANGIWLFDRANLIVGAAGPLVAVGLVWSGCTLYKFVAEKAERMLVERRFRSYVDPALVDYVLEHPEQATLDGQVSELTVVFTDLAGFTSLSERLREKTVQILNEYMELMVPIISAHNGYVNKFLGDGIMFFYGAPRGNNAHALDAVETALHMQQAMVGFNEQLVGRELPEVSMRVGISSGNMVVGDAGSKLRADYTVLGDTVNLGARLESANKASGTAILINARVAIGLEDKYLLRPVGRLQVVGKSQGIMTFEPLCTMADATAEQKRLVEMTDEMVNAYILGRFEKCLAAARSLDKDHGPSKLTALYSDVCNQFLRQPPGADFLGQIVLEEK